MPGLESLYRLPPLSPLASHLDRAREERLDALLDAHRNDVATVHAARARLLEDPRDPEAVHVTDEAARRLLGELRAPPPPSASDDTLARGAQWLDEHVL